MFLHISVKNGPEAGNGKLNKPFVSRDTLVPSHLVYLKHPYDECAVEDQDGLCIWVGL